MNSLFKSFALVFFLGLFSAICFEIKLDALAFFFGTSAFVSIMMFPLVEEMFE